MLWLQTSRKKHKHRVAVDLASMRFYFISKQGKVPQNKKWALIFMQFKTRTRFELFSLQNVALKHKYSRVLKTARNIALKH